MSKALVCPCEDVTVEEVQHALDKGFRDIESVKRYTGFGTGMCQGKQCLTAVANVLCQHAKPTPREDQILPFTPRPPLYPTPLATWASNPVDATATPQPGVPRGVELTHASLKPAAPIPQKAKVVIIGGGIMGLASPPLRTAERSLDPSKWAHSTATTVPGRLSHAPRNSGCRSRSRSTGLALLPQPMWGAAPQTSGTS